MIRIRINGEPGEVRGFLIWGHAGEAPYGEDIVCASVSALSTAALVGLTEMVPGSAKYRLLPEGLIYCRLERDIPKEDGMKAQAIVSTMVLGLAAVWGLYGDYIDFAYRR